MSELFSQSELKDLIEKVERGERLDSDDGVRMMNSLDILALGYMANLMRERKSGNRTYYKIISSLDYTNVNSDLGDQADLTEIHLMGEFKPELTFEYYLQMLEHIKCNLPKVRIQAFSPLEVDYFSGITKQPVTEILQRLMEAGLDSLSVKMNISEERYLEIQEAAHRIGMLTNATMFYGNIVTNKEHIDHLLKLRKLQDETGGFLSFMPCSLDNSTGFEDLKILSVSRILLDNVDHIKASLSVLGPKLTQVSLAFGVDDLDSHGMTKRALVHLIEKARREAVEQRGKESSACKQKTSE